MSELTVAEFFAGAGLVRKALEAEGVRVVFANDIDPVKYEIYTANFGSSEFHLGDVRDVRGRDIPDIDIATASFPCTDLSLAGGRKGLSGPESGVLWEFIRILREMKARRPPVLLIENVVGFLTSNDGRDLQAAIRALNRLCYSCDVLTIDASLFLPQSRPRVFIVACQTYLELTEPWEIGPFRTRAAAKSFESMRGALLHSHRLPQPGPRQVKLSDIIQRFGSTSSVWWDDDRQAAFVQSLSELQTIRLTSLIDGRKTNWATAYRRTRSGKPVWEIRTDGLAGCLRTTGGGSSKQAVVEAGRGSMRVRWMTGSEYAALQGAEDLAYGNITESQQRFALGDAVCVPAVRWLVRHYLVPMAMNGNSRILAYAAK